MFYNKQIKKLKASENNYCGSWKGKKPSGLIIRDIGQKTRTVGGGWGLVTSNHSYLEGLNIQIGFSFLQFFAVFGKERYVGGRRIELSSARVR